MPHALIIKGQIGQLVEYAKGETFELSEGETLLSLDTLEAKAAPMVAAIQAAVEKDAMAKATESSNDRLKKLKEAFPNNPGLALEAFLSGKTAEQVKAEQYDKTAKELAKAKKKLAEVQRGPAFRASDDDKPEEEDDDKPEEEDDDEDKTSEEDDDEDKTSEEDDDEDKTSEEDNEDDKQTERRAKSEWRRNKKIRQEFGSFKTFLAYKKAERRKAFKVLRN